MNQFPTNLWWYDAVQIFALILILGGLGYVLVKLSRLGENQAATTTAVAGVDDKVNTIMSNHLPHIQADVTQLRDQFVEHLQNHPRT